MPLINNKSDHTKPCSTHYVYKFILLLGLRNTTQFPSLWFIFVSFMIIGLVMYMTNLIRFIRDGLKICKT